MTQRFLLRLSKAYYPRQSYKHFVDTIFGFFQVSFSNENTTCNTMW